MKFLLFGFLFTSVCALSLCINQGEDSDDFYDNEVNLDVSRETKKTEKLSEKKIEEVNGSGEIGDRQRLINYMFSEGYDKRNYPTNMTVKLGVNLIKIDIDESKSTLEADVWIRMMWSDKRLAWDQSEFNVGVLRMNPQEIWYPDTTLYNSATPFEMMKCSETNTLIYPNGDVLWVPPCHLSALCNLTVSTDPYGPQKCMLKFGSWTFDGLSMDLQAYDGENKADASNLWDTTEWAIVSNDCTREVKYYDCCPEPYVSLTFNLGVQKKACPLKTASCGA